MSTKPKILITNDDGINSLGIQTLISIAKQIGDVFIVAPNKGQSGMSHAITIENPISYKELQCSENIKVKWECSGTPVDCIKLALGKVFLTNKPDICLSGINHGSNASINVLYSGTMSAALEASMNGISSIGFSFCNHSWDVDLLQFQDYITKIIGYVLDKKENLSQEICLNVNIPDLEKEKIKGIKLCHPTKAYWESNITQQINPPKNSCYWITGELKPKKQSFPFQENKKKDLEDLSALKEGYISVVPIGYDLTNYIAIDELKKVGFP